MPLAGIKLNSSDDKIHNYNGCSELYSMRNGVEYDAVNYYRGKPMLPQYVFIAVTARILSSYRDNSNKIYTATRCGRHCNICGYR